MARDERIHSVYAAGADKEDASSTMDVATTKANINADMADPLRSFRGMPAQMIIDDGKDIAIRELGLAANEAELFGKGALLALSEDATDLHPAHFHQSERDVIDHEREHPWKSIPKTLYSVVILASLCAAVQGMDETVVNGAQIFYNPQFGIENSPWLSGLVNSAPYLACAVLGCWASIPLNKKFGRRGTIFLTCANDIVCCIGQACVSNWWQMFIVRFLLGIGVGAKSATVPVYSAECAPSRIRGALTMQWQMWTAFGIMIGFASDLVFFQVKDIPGITGLNWRLMMGSACLFAIFVCLGIFTFCPESPRYLVDKAGRLLKQGDAAGALECRQQAWSAMCKLRSHDLLAARDTYVMLKAAEVQERAAEFRGSAFHELVHVPRNRRAMIASQITMFMQQFCGINVIAYYSSEIFLGAGFSQQDALIASLGFGAINFLFAIPAIKTIDTFGRRSLLLMSFPAMAACLFFTGFSFLITSQKANIACVALGIYLFGMVYSPGEGPVPFVYSAEAYPLYIRTHGMALATATTWFFNFLLAITWPGLLKAFKPTGAFCYYGAWCMIGYVLILLFVPETKGKSLEELDAVFSVKTSDMVKYGMAELFYAGRYIMTLGQNPGSKPVLPVVVGGDDLDEKRRYVKDEETRTESNAHTLVADRGMSNTSKFVDEISSVSPNPI